MSTFSAPAGATTGLQGYDLEGADTRKHSKREANYVRFSETQQCMSCIKFVPPDGCQRVEGQISPSGHCEYYVSLTAKVTKNIIPKAAGIAIATDEGKVLFLKRSDEGDHAGEWCVPGGMIEPGETAEQAAIRELKEETGYTLPPGDRRAVLTVDGPVPYVTFFQRIGEDEFEPTLNSEHTEYRWLHPDITLKPLHPGLRAALPHLISEVTQFTMKAAAMENLALFVPLLKVDAQKRMIYGTAIAEVPDRVSEIFDYTTSKPNFEKWSDDISKSTDGRSVGNLRSMHGKVAAGKLTEIAYDDGRKAIDIAAKVVDDDEWNKVMEGVYSGLSIGGRYGKRWKDGELTRYTAVPSEISLVDLPCVPGATFTIVKGEGIEEVHRFKEPESEVITNDKIALRATEIAKTVGDDRDWGDYIPEARKQLQEEAASRLAARKKNIEEVNKDRAELTKDADKDREEALQIQVSPRSAADGEWEQVWVHKKLPSQTFARKSDMLKALVALEAKEDLDKKTAGIRAALEGKEQTTAGKVWISNAELPKTTQGLPDEAKSVFREAANGAIKGGNDDTSAMKIGWTAVKNGWAKKGDKWVRKETKKGFLDGELLHREYSPDQRSKYAKQGVAMSDGSFPISDKAALKDAVSIYDRSGHSLVAKRHIARRARALEATDLLPEAWGYGQSKKYAHDMLDKLHGEDLDKAASLYLVADMLHALSSIESLEEQLEFEINEDDAPMFRSALVNVDDALLDRMGKLLVEFGDIITEVLSQLLDARSADEAREAMERAQPVTDLIKVGAKYSREAKAKIQAIYDAIVTLYETALETKVRPPGKAGDDPFETSNYGRPAATRPGHTQDKDGEVTVRPKRVVGSDHPGPINPGNVGDITPFKDMSAEDLRKLAAQNAVEISELTEKIEAKDKATDEFVAKIGEMIAEKLTPLQEEKARLEKELAAEKTEGRQKLGRLQADITAIRNSPFPAPGPFRVVEKTIDTERRLPAISPGASTEELRAAANEAHLNRIFNTR